MAGRVVTGIRRLWPRTRRGQVLAVLGVLVFFVLDVLALLRSDLALDLLIFLSGALAGWAVARVATYPFRRKPGVSGVGRIVGLFLGLASVFAIIFGGTALAGIPPYPTAEGGDVGNAIYGLALGVLVGVPGGLAPASLAPAARRGPSPTSRSEIKVLATVFGTVAVLFGSLFVLYLIIEYAFVPLVRSLAA